MSVLYQPDYVGLLNGDVQCALMLSQLVYWYRPGTNGKSRLRVRKQTDGKWWIAKSWKEWEQECGLSRAQSRRCLTKLQSVGLIELKVYRFNGRPTAHVRFPWVPSGNTLVDIPTAAQLRQLRSAGISAVLPNDPSQSTVLPPPVQNSFAASPLATNDQSITVITSDTTTEKEQEGGKGAALLPIPPPQSLTEQNPAGGEGIGEKEDVKEQKQKENEEIQSELTQHQEQDQTCTLVTESSGPVGQKAPSGWMNAGKPLPKALMPIPENNHLKALIKINTEGVPALKEQCHSNTMIPTSAKAGPLGTYWKARLDELEPNKYHRAVKKDEFGMLGHLGNYLADDAGKVIDFVLRHWTDFGWQALNNAGVKAYPPQEPNIGFLLQYHATAVNMMLKELQSIAETKAYVEAQAQKTAQATAAKKPAKVLTIQETPIIKLGFTPEQLHLLLDIDTDQSFSDKVTQKYGDNWQPASLVDKDAIPCEIDFELAG